MSVVTSLLITFGSGENERYVVDQLAQYDNNGRGFSAVSVDDERLPRGWYGGTKYLEATILIGAYNCLNLDGLIDHIRSMHWEDPEDVQLILKRQEDDRFSIINVFDET